MSDKIKDLRGLVKNGDGKFACYKCGKSDALRMVAHFDGRDCYGYTYNCECGNVASITYKRDKNERMWW